MKHSVSTLLLLCMVVSLPSIAQDNVPFTKATDLYYGTAYSTNYNHQLWLTTEGMTYDPVNSTMTGSDGYVMRLDLFCKSATDLTGEYTIVGPAYADKPGCMNKKFTYWTYWVDGGFVDKKLTEGTCTIVCTSVDTYDITYSVKEIDKGPSHKGTIHDIHIKAVTENGQNYTLKNQCTNVSAIENQYENESENRKRIENGQVIILRSNHRYNILGQSVE